MNAAPGIEIRWHDGQRADLRHMFELAESSAAQLDAYMPRGRVLVALAEGSIVGHLQLVTTGTDGEFEIQSLAVVEPRRRGGIGRVLVERAIAQSRAEGARTLLVSTATADTGALRFYQRVGFRLLRVERDAFTPQTGYPDAITFDGIPLRDRIWLSMAL